VDQCLQVEFLQVGNHPVGLEMLQKFHERGRIHVFPAEIAACRTTITGFDGRSKGVATLLDFPLAPALE
jgi:hypothetical protein